MREIIAISYAVVGQSTKHLDHLCETPGMSVPLPPGLVFARARSLTNRLLRCGRISAAEDRLQSSGGGTEEQEYKTVLAKIEDEMGIVASCLQAVIEELQKYAERSGNDQEFGSINDLRLRILSLNSSRDAARVSETKTTDAPRLLSNRRTPARADLLRAASC